MFRKKALSETAIKGIVYQFRYLINDKKASDEELSWHLSKTLSNLGASKWIIFRNRLLGERKKSSSFFRL